MALFSFCDTFTIQVAARSYTINASAGKGGSISPSGKVKVERDDDQSFIIAPDEGYEILDVKVDGHSQGAIEQYTFSNVRSNHKIEVTFTKKSYTITPAAGANGTIEPAQPTLVDQGSNLVFTITPNEGYLVDKVLVDGVSVGPVTSYTFTDISSDHTIVATFIKENGILNLTIPNVSMKIGDVVTATLTVDHDGGDPFTLVTGTVGGYPLEGFQRISPTTYQATFTIIQGGNSYDASQDIPVSNLVITNGADQSPPFNYSINQNSDPIDALLPAISSMEVGGGNKKIGDVVVLSIVADGNNYSLHQASTINGISVDSPNVSFTESGGGSYKISYTVQEGDPEVIAGSQEFTATVILVKPSGNRGLPYPTLSNPSQITIDSHAPVISNMEVPTKAVGVGGTVRVSLTADGIGYRAGAGTVINGVPLSSSRVTFTEHSYGLYELSYTISMEDGEVAPGELQVTIVPVDPAGNVGQTYFTLEPNGLEIYTDLPEAMLAGPTEICEGEGTELDIILNGREPWSFILSDGSSTTSYSNIGSANYKITVTPLQTTTYQINSVMDMNGVENTGMGSVQVRVYERIEVEIINLAAGYNVEAGPVKLEANIAGGTFSGPGVFSSTGYFYPELAGISDSPHTIVYTFENSSGCVSSDSKLVHVLGSEGTILLPTSTVCANEDPFVVTVLNVPGQTGSFRLLDSASEPVSSGLTDHKDNTATIEPSFLNPDVYTIEFQYFNGDNFYLREGFSLNPAPQLLILNLDESTYCQHTEPVELRSNLEEVLFEGPGVSGNINDGFTFDPGGASPGNVTISGTLVSDNGCSAKAQKSVGILAAPEVKFGMSTACIPEGGEIVAFDNQTIGKSSVETWKWNFGDIPSGPDNQSDQVDPTHFYQEPGQKIISLTATTYDGCVTAAVIDSVIDSKPVADFTWISDCFAPGSGVKFVNRTDYGSSSVDTILWRFRTMEGTVLDEIGSVSPTDTLGFSFSSADKYLVDLYTTSRGGCAGELTREISLQPTIQLDSEGYKESFDTDKGLWTIRSEDKVESWVWDVPDFEGYTSEPGDRAWFTRLPAEGQGYHEYSWIQSPCFDFTGIDRPLIQLDIMRSFLPALNGAVLQYKDLMEEGWKTIGAHTPGIGWYNAANILNQPGGSNVGWGMDVFNPDTEWVTAVHDLDQVDGHPNVAFRVVIATNGKEGLGNQGFAFDNVVIMERTKLAVLEHFTDYSDDTSRVADDIVDDLWKSHKQDVIDLQYHMSYYGTDPMNAYNPLPSSVRSFNYGVPRVPFSVLDGGANDYHRYAFEELKGTALEDQLRLLTLEIPKFDIELSVDWGESGLEAQTTVTCVTDRFDENIHLYLVLFETSVTSYTGRNGDTQFRNVVLDILPTPAGKLLGDNWVLGKSDVRTHTWSYKPFIEDIDELAMVAFVQDRSTSKIIQAEVVYKDQTVGVKHHGYETPILSIFPNPASTSFTADLGTESTYQGSLELTEITGQVVLKKDVPPGTRMVQVGIEHLDRGIYLLRWIESGKVRGVSKFVKSH